MRSRVSRLQLRQMLKTLIRTRHKDIEQQFRRIDRSSYGELTPDLLMDLFTRSARLGECRRRHDIARSRLRLPQPVTSAELDLIWSQCHLKENGRLEFHQFVREFGYSKGSAHYPNAKWNPPRRGDADSLLTSRKLYGDTVLVHETALNAIRAHWNELRREFVELDPYRTGLVHGDEFDEIVGELCPAVNNDDLDNLKATLTSQSEPR
jgi:hypothetical protein